MRLTRVSGSLLDNFPPMGILFANNPIGNEVYFRKSKFD